MREIEKRAGISRRMIRRVAVEAGVQPVRERRARTRWRFLDKKILEELYVKEGLPLHDIARRLGAGSNTVSRELDRHGISKHKPGGNHKRGGPPPTFPEIRLLQVGESLDLPAWVPASRAKRPGDQYYSMARWIGMRVSIKRIDESTVRVTRKK